MVARLTVRIAKMIKVGFRRTVALRAQPSEGVSFAVPIGGIPLRDLGNVPIRVISIEIERRGCVLIVRIARRLQISSSVRPEVGVVCAILLDVRIAITPDMHIDDERFFPRLIVPASCPQEGRHDQRNQYGDAMAHSQSDLTIALHPTARTLMTIF